MPTKGIGGRERVADRRVAAVRIPAIEPVGLQPQPDDAMLSLREGQRGGRHLDDIAAALRIEEIGASELMRKRLTVVAVADDAIDGARRKVRRRCPAPPRNGSAVRSVRPCGPRNCLPELNPPGDRCGREFAGIFLLVNAAPALRWTGRFPCPFAQEIWRDRSCHIAVRAIAAAGMQRRRAGLPARVRPLSRSRNCSAAC